MLALLALSLAACDVEQTRLRLRAEVEALYTVLTGGRSPFAKVRPAPSPPAPSPGPSVQPRAVSAQTWEANAQLLREVWSVLYEEEPKDRALFGGYVNILNQGGSLEGIYNGFAHSDFMREKETRSPGCTPEALQAFAQELARIEAQLPTKTQFTAESAKPLAHAVTPGAAPGAARQPVPAPSTAVTILAMAESYARIFAPASRFTLKRALGEEALKLIFHLRSSRPALASWYGPWAARLNRMGVDFGLELRNKPDIEFHKQWAMGASEDQITWEVLNRLLRLINAKSPRGSGH